MRRRDLPLLWQYRFSNFNEKVRWALAHKRIPHRRRSYPADPREREQALALEEYFDEHAGHDVRRLGFMEWWDEKEFGVAVFTTDQPAAVRFGVHKLQGIVRPALWRFSDRRYGSDRESLERSRAAIVAALDRIEAERGGGDYLVAQSFSVADLTAAALLYSLVWPSEYLYELPERPTSTFLDSIKDHPAVGWLTGIWRRHRGQSAEVR